MRVFAFLAATLFPIGAQAHPLVDQVSGCWNAGSLSTAAASVTIRIGIDIDQNSMPLRGSVRLIGYSGGDEASAEQAFQAGRRAILTCAASGQGLSAVGPAFIILEFGPDGVAIPSAETTET